MAPHDGGKWPAKPSQGGFVMVLAARRTTEPMQIDVEDVEEAAGRSGTSRLVLPSHVKSENNRLAGRETGEASIFAHPAAVRKISTRANDQLLELAKGRAFSPEILDEAPPFFWGAEISSSRLDAYYTRMAKSTLKNFAEGAAAGVSFQNSHSTRELGIGYSLTGSFKNGGGADNEENPMRVEASFYTIPGLQAGSLSTDMFIRGVLAGIYRDVSVGFYGGTMTCSVCGQDIWSWDCWHIPGVEYEGIDPKTGDPSGERELAIAWINDAYLAEVSVVYDGATPGAAILKAEQEAEAGRMKPATARMLEARYRIKLPGAERRYASAEVPSPPKEEKMGTQAATRDAGAPATAAEETQVAAAEAAVVPAPEVSPVDAERAAIAEIVSSTDTIADGDVSNIPAEAGEARSEASVTVAEAAAPAPAVEAAAPAPVVEAPNPGQNTAPAAPVVSTPEQRAAIEQVVAAPVQPPDPAIAGYAHVRAALREAGVPDTTDPAQAIRSLVRTIHTLRPQAADGVVYRTDLIEETLAEGVRAFGPSWDVEMYRGMCQGLSIPHIKRMRDDFSAKGGTNFPGGRATTEAAADAPSAPSGQQTAAEQRGQIDDLWDGPMPVPDALFR